MEECPIYLVFPREAEGYVMGVIDNAKDLPMQTLDDVLRSSTSTFTGSTLTKL